MAKPKSHISVILFSLYVYAASGIEISGTPENGVDHAAGKTAFSDQIKNGSDPKFAVDGNLSTCMETNAVKESRIRIDLGLMKVITGVALTVKQEEDTRERLNYIEIYISNDPRGDGDVCKFMTFNSAEDYVACSRPLPGRYVLLKNPKKSAIRICELQVIECADNYYGPACEGECHCLDSQVCDKLSGSCPSACAPGYRGDNCSLTCDDTTFGPDCASECHCAQGDPCDSETGTCSNGCAVGWKGSDCQTQVPTISKQPELESSDSFSITLKLPSWTGTISEGFSVQYVVEYMEYYSRDKPWSEGAVVNMDPSKVDQVATVDKLKINTLYRFRVQPQLLEDGEVIEQGAVGPMSKPFKTKCMEPEAPTVTKLIPGTSSRYPPTASITVQWEAPPKNGIRCDNIAYYKILYSKEASEGVWQNTKAGQSATSKEITGLDFSSTYHVIVVVVNNEELDGQSRTMSIDTGVAFATGTDTQDGDKKSNLLFFIIGAVVGIMLLLMIIFISIILVRRHKSKYATIPKRDLDADSDIVLNQLTPLNKKERTNDSGIIVEPASYRHTPSSSAESFNHIRENPIDPPTPEAPKPTEHFPVPIEELEEYVMQRRDNDSKPLKAEYKEFPEGPQHPWEHGKLKENKHKNKFINIIAYDHTRVKLEPIENVPDSDYINANYVDGYGKEKYYIASQGCNKWTTQDFWRMTWEQNCLRIVMVTNLVENGKRKCEQYWPEHMNDEKPYGDLTVTWVDMEQTSDFCIRTFTLKRGEESRNVKQFHFTAWPDHGVPIRAAPIIAFRRKVRSFDDTHPGTTVVHCSAGVGRTGTYIAIDYLLEMAKDEKKVDLYNLTKRMRDCRVNMIQTEEQYVFVYDALLEALKTGDTAIPCSEFRMEFEALLQIDSDTEEEEDEGQVQPHGEGKSKLQKQFENLQSVSPRIKKEDCQSGALPENIDKNRNQQILPADRHRPYLMTKVQGTNDYINAVFLDGYKSRNSHIMTQMPMPHTVIDFWRMVHEHNVGSIVMLNAYDDNDETQGPYWPEDTACECGPFIIEPVGVNTDKSDITVRELKVTYQHSSPVTGRKFGEPKERTVNLFQYLAWPADTNLPASKTSLMCLIDMVEKSQYKTGNGPVLIHCFDGASRSGLYAAISCIWEKMKLEQEVDIFHTVKHLRYHRHQVVQSLEQYKFCFEMVLAFLAEFETYANFTWKGNGDSAPDSD